MYEHPTSSVHVNGYISKPLSLNCLIGQGCQLIMLLFTLCPDPLLRTLQARLTASSQGSYKYRTAVIAYADDITIILRFPKDATIVQEEGSNTRRHLEPNLTSTAIC